MTEEEYIVVGDLKTTIAAEAVLHDICSANNIHIPDVEYRQVMQLLAGWREAIFDNITNDDTNDNVRRITERGLKRAQEQGSSGYVDIFQHILDELERI